jgi:hypothetical protein
VTARNELVLSAGALALALWSTLRWLETRAAAGAARHILIASYFALLAFAGSAPLLLPLGSAALLARRLSVRSLPR